VKQILHHFREERNPVDGSFTYIPDEDRKFIFFHQEYELEAFVGRFQLTGTLSIIRQRNGKPEKYVVSCIRLADGRESVRGEDVLMRWEEKNPREFDALHAELMDRPRVLSTQQNQLEAKAKLAAMLKKLPGRMVAAKRSGTSPPQVAPEILSDTEQAKEGAFE